MSSAGSLVSEVIAELHGWGVTNDRITALSQSMSPTDTTFTVNASYGPANGVSPGVVEIGSELIYVASVDPNSNACTVAPGGRGYLGTTAASHNPNDLVITGPQFPRYYVLRKINETIGGLFPDLFAVKTWTGVVTFPNNTYTLNPVPTAVLDAQWQDPIGRWIKAKSYQVDPFDGTFRLGAAMVGRPLRVVYAAEPSTLASEADDFATVTGLPDSTADLVMLGTVAKFVVGQDLARAQIDTVEQSDRARLVPPGTAENAAKWFTANFQQRLDNEAASLRKRYKPRVVRTW